MATAYKKFDNSVTMLKDVPFYFTGSVYYVDLIMKITSMDPNPDVWGGDAGNVQIMIDLAAMSEILYKKYPELIDSAAFDCIADTPFMPGTQDQGYCLYPVLTGLS